MRKPATPILIKHNSRFCSGQTGEGKQLKRRKHDALIYMHMHMQVQFVLSLRVVHVYDDKT